MQSPLMPAPTTTVSATSATERPWIERLGNVESAMEQRSFGKRERAAERVETKGLVGVWVKRGIEPRRKTEEVGRSVAVVVVMAIVTWCELVLLSQRAPTLFYSSINFCYLQFPFSRGGGG